MSKEIGVYDSDEDPTPFVEYEIGIQSPRFMDACRRQGIETKELHKKTLREVKEMHKKDNLNRQGLILVAQHYEERRRAKIKMVLNERTRIIDGESIQSPGEHLRSPQASTEVGTTSVYSPLPGSCKTQKEARELGELIHRQQREIDELMQNVETVQDRQEDPIREENRYNALNAQYELKFLDRPIEVINNDEFNYTRGQLKILRKHKNKKELSASKYRQHKQQNVYKREIENTKQTQEKNQQKAQKKDYFNRLVKVEGNLLESKVVTVSYRNSLTPKLPPTKQYFQDYLKGKQEEALKRKGQLESTINMARTESQKWFDSTQMDHEKSVKFAEQRDRNLGSALKKSLQEARNKPGRDTMQKPIFREDEEEEPICYRRSVEYNMGESSDEEWEKDLYLNPKSPLKGMSTMGTWRPIDSYTNTAKNVPRRKDEFDWYEKLRMFRESYRSGSSSDWFIMHQRFYDQPLDNYKGAPSLTSQFVHSAGKDIDQTLFAKFQSPKSTARGSVGTGRGTL